eukprot:3723255-Prymnesium_polylepis.1
MGAVTAERPIPQPVSSLPMAICHQPSLPTHAITSGPQRKARLERKKQKRGPRRASHAPEKAPIAAPAFVCPTIASICESERPCEPMSSGSVPTITPRS